jgi:hypothetical protein
MPMSAFLAWTAAHTTARSRLRARPQSFLAPKASECRGSLQRRTQMDNRNANETEEAPKKMSKSTMLVAVAFIGGLLLLILVNM